MGMGVSASSEMRLATRLPANKVFLAHVASVQRVSAICRAGEEVVVDSVDRARPFLGHNPNLLLRFGHFLGFVSTIARWAAVGPAVAPRLAHCYSFQHKGA